MYYDSTGKPIQVGNVVKFRGELYTIKEFISPREGSRFNQILFEEDQHTEEVADEFAVDLIRHV